MLPQRRDVLEGVESTVGSTAGPVLEGGKWKHISIDGRRPIS